MPESESVETFQKKMWNALLRLICLAVFGAAHWLLSKGVAFIVPENFQSGRLWFEDIAFVAFGLIYLFLLWEMVLLFLPAGSLLRRRIKPTVADEKGVQSEEV